LAIGATFLALVVGFFPSTVPTSSLGFVPKLAAPAPVSTGQTTPTTSPSPVQPPSDLGFAAGDDTYPAFSDTGTGSPVATSTGAPVTAPATTGTTGSGTVGSGAHATCPLPLPAEPPAPPAAELIEALAIAGPFGPEATAGVAALAPVVPVVAPLFPLAAGVAGGKNGVLVSEALVQIANLEDEVFAPFSSELATVTPEAVAGDEKFFQEIGPVLTLASNLPDLACVGDVEIAAGSTLVPADYPNAIPLTAYGPSATSVNNRVVTVSTSWAEGITPSFSRAVDSLIAQGDSVEMHLYDDAPAGQAGDDQGFATWVTGTVAAFPKVAIWEVDPYLGTTATTGASAPTDPALSLAAALAAAARARAPGQLLGVGLPAQSAPWWSQFGSALEPAVRSVINFAGLDTTGFNGGSGLSPAGLHWIVTLLRRGTLAQAGLPAQLPLFVTAGTTAPMSDAAQSVVAAQDAAGLSGLGVGLLTWSSPSTLGGQLFSNIDAAENLLSALARPATP
jgi:hypothetical protein